MPQVPLPPDVSVVYQTLLPDAVTRPRADGDLRAQCRRCPAYLDASTDDGWLWLDAHMRIQHGSPAARTAGTP